MMRLRRRLRAPNFTIYNDNRHQQQQQQQKKAQPKQAQLQQPKQQLLPSHSPSPVNTSTAQRDKFPVHDRLNAFRQSLTIPHANDSAGTYDPADRFCRPSANGRGSGPQRKPRTPHREIQPDSGGTCIFFFPLLLLLLVSASSPSLSPLPCLILTLAAPSTPHARSLTDLYVFLSPHYPSTPPALSLDPNILRPLYLDPSVQFLLPCVTVNLPHLHLSLLHAPQ